MTDPRGEAERREGWGGFVVELARSAATWALGAAMTTAVVGGVARALCLRPYWPAGYALRCRPDGLLVAVLQAIAESAVTTLLLTVPALAVGVGIFLLVRAAERLGSPKAAPVVGAVAGAGAWVLLARHLEPSYLDFILGGYAIGAGALVAALVAARRMPRALVAPRGPRYPSRGSPHSPDRRRPDTAH